MKAMLESHIETCTGWTSFKYIRAWGRLLTSSVTLVSLGDAGKEIGATCCTWPVATMTGWCPDRIASLVDKLREMSLSRNCPRIPGFVEELCNKAFHAQESSSSNSSSAVKCSRESAKAAAGAAVAAVKSSSTVNSSRDSDLTAAAAVFCCCINSNRTAKF